jgi:hypothetical protein
MSKARLNAGHHVTRELSYWRRKPILALVGSDAIVMLGSQGETATAARKNTPRTCSSSAHTSISCHSLPMPRSPERMVVSLHASIAAWQAWHVTRSVSRISPMAQIDSLVVLLFTFWTLCEHVASLLSYSVRLVLSFPALWQ